MIRIISLFFAVFSICLSTIIPAFGSQDYAYIGATIIDGNGDTPIRSGVVLTRDNRIVAIGSESSVSIPAEAKRIDVKGKYIIPGLMDANVHLFPWPSWSYVEFLARYENNMEGVIAEGAQLALKNGITTVFDTMGPLKPLMAVRDQINSGELDGARMFVAGNILGFRAVFPANTTATKPFQNRINRLFEANGGPELNWLPPEELYKAVTRYIAQGVDFIKYGATGDGIPINSEVGQFGVLRFTPDQQKAIVKAARDAGVTVQSHQMSAESLHIVVDSGVNLAQHCSSVGPSRIADKTIKLMLESDFYCGTQFAPLTESEQAELKARKFSRTTFDNMATRLPGELEEQIRLIEAGVPMVLSTDAGTIDPDVLKEWGGEPYGGLGGYKSVIGHAEYQAMYGMYQRGMSPMQVIQAATKNVASAYNVLDDLGTLETGKIADLLVLDSNPLKDITKIRESIVLIVKEGKVVNRETLPHKPILTSPQAVNPKERRFE